MSTLHGVQKIATTENVGKESSARGSEEGTRKIHYDISSKVDYILTNFARGGLVFARHSYEE